MARRGMTNILLLGATSLITDLSSDMIMPLLPLFIASLGGGGVVVGLAGGLGDSLSSLLKVVSGRISDVIGRRKLLVLLGYLSSSVAKLLFPLAQSGYDVVAIRFFERMGKGIRTAPRDALVAAYSTESTRGKGFGIHRAMDTTGAVLGSVLALLLIWVFGFSMRTILLMAAIIGFFALLPLYFVEDVKTSPLSGSSRLALAGLSPQLKRLILATTLFALGNFSYMFFVLRASTLFSERLAIAVPIALYIVFNIVYALSTIPAGSLSDRIGRKRGLLVGYGLFFFTCVGFALFSSAWMLVPLFMLYGLSYGFIEPIERAYVSDLARSELRGTALGTFHASVGLATLPASLMAGFLWDAVSYSATFLWGACASFTAICALVLLVRDGGGQ
ncbi:MFS transporter [Methermicoccus shengliensis]|uniref:MFS transporter n=1 Tax=Methermicoccus shengliensis TaxID=660064 RepID=A0A832RVK9_9EURY|nr:MFS transporter [Methermicoccus shengliensis]KUK04685.1 MAG: Major facilitator superfamily MFS_1 [Euryarchaeota archaeon 55_53]KUK29601.1 MAG: Major facilitator superfamily MFS_1 [Methanosarcinales archeaon 56_1174]MDI3487921.1 hypothetical protein [Methanosarcinales archaeon]MDN5295059.1 hypothetical protein [Methanosarcinales archaeon]HIH69083.1 MFS transporter [Methermicoccus shengliensis]